MKANPNRRVREVRRAREIRDWQKLATRNREHRDRPQPEEQP